MRVGEVLIARVVSKLELGGAQLSLLRVARTLAGRGHQTRLRRWPTLPGVSIVSMRTARAPAFGRATGQPCDQLRSEVTGPTANWPWECQLEV
ncbi:MAG: hypothetical protein JJE35_01600 [Thermoleophilia bacterium]|nr:hypothetical protein [Thermoleophilia bacterium]